MHRWAQWHGSGHYQHMLAFLLRLRHFVTKSLDILLAIFLTQLTRCGQDYLSQPQPTITALQSMHEIPKWIRMYLVICSMWLRNLSTLLQLSLLSWLSLLLLLSLFTSVFWMLRWIAPLLFQMKYILYVFLKDYLLLFESLICMDLCYVH